MKTRSRSFRRYVFFTLLVLESLTLLVVIGFLYVMVDRSITLEYQHQLDATRAEMRSFLVERAGNTQTRVEEISNNNSLKISLLLDMFGKVSELMNHLYPPANGASFYVLHPSGKFVPEPEDSYRFLRDTIKMPPNSQRQTRVSVRPSILAFFSPIIRNNAVVGHVVGIYDMASDPRAFELVRQFPYIQLLAKRSREYIDLKTGKPVKATGLPKVDAGHLELTSPADDSTDSAMFPIRGFPDLFISASYRPLIDRKHKLIRNLILLCLPLLGLTLTVSFLILKKVTSPLNAMAQDAVRIAENPSGRNLAEKGIRHGEFLHLAKAFNKVLSANRQRTEELNTANLKLQRQIEERQRVALALADSESRLRSLQNNIPIGLFRSTLEGRFLSVNPMLAKIFGYESETQLRQVNAELLYQDPKERDMYLTELKFLKMVQAKRIRFRHRDGTPFWGSMHVKLVEDAHTGETYLDGTVQDITEQVKAAEEKRKLEMQLRQAQKMESIGTLAGGIAHDFNNILASIIGFSELALEDAEAQTLQQENLRYVLIAANRAKNLVNQILAFARQSDVEQRPMQPQLILKEALKFIRSTLPTTIRVKEQIQSQTTILADPTQIHQIIVNLCSNANHAMQPSGGELTISLVDEDIDKPIAEQPIKIAPGRYVRLSVTDSGQGIPESILERIFEPFFTTKEQGKGTGMGLAVVQGIVRSHRGFVTVESVPGKGATFNVFLPEMVAPELSEEDEVKPLVGGHEHILFVDDEDPITRMGKQMLERLGYTVTTRTSSVEALELFHAAPRRFDLVMTDMTMPEMTGDRLAQEMIKIRPDIPIILCTGYSQQITAETAATMGIRSYAYKPLVKKQLAATIRAVLDRQIAAPEQSEYSYTSL